MKYAIALASVLASLFLVTPAHAERAGMRGADSSYGRIEGDLSFVFGLGATFGPRAPRGTVDARLRYLDTIGMFATYEEGFGGAAEPRRVLATGVELRPLFIGRWLQGRELDSPRLDLAIDSIGLELGAFFAHPVGDTFGSKRGLQAGLGLEVPVLAQANGPWIGLHGGVRWSDDALGGAPLRGPSDRAAYLTVTLAWHAFFGAHVVDLQDRRAER